MRKVIVIEFITLDGVIQAGGGPEEDTSGGFAYGGWEVPYGDDVVGAAITRQMNMPFDLLLGRKTFEIWRLLTDLHQIITRLDVVLVWLGVGPCRV
jgi:dihydrofolate reductase